jgi:hypothetical protein
MPGSKIRPRRKASKVDEWAIGVYLVLAVLGLLAAFGFAGYLLFVSIAKVV